MSNQKPTVWITNRLDIADNIYCIELSFPEIIEYPEYEELNRKEGAHNLTEEERSKIEYTRKDLINIIIKYGDFKKIDLLPDSMWSVLLDPVIAKGKVMNVPNPEDSIFAVRDGYILVTKPCAEILQRFRLSNTQMIPLQLFNPKTRELVNEETYYLLNIYAWRTYFDGKNNEIFINKNYKDYGYNIYTPPYNIKNGDCVLCSTALQCDVDLWHDPSVRGSIFLSQALREALHEAKMLKTWFLHSCKMI